MLHIHHELKNSIFNTARVLMIRLKKNVNGANFHTRERNTMDGAICFHSDDSHINVYRFIFSARETVKSLSSTSLRHELGVGSKRCLLESDSLVSGQKRSGIDADVELGEKQCPRSLYLAHLRIAKIERHSRCSSAACFCKPGLKREPTGAGETQCRRIFKREVTALFRLVAVHRAWLAVSVFY